MSFLDDITNGAQKAQPIPPEIQQAEQKCRNAENAVNDALLALGKQVYESAKEKTDSEFGEQISQVTESIKKSELWKQYRLALEGKMKCEKCGAIITSDSVFCNKCGTSIAPLDFSSLGLNASTPATSSATPNNVCPSCGATLVEGAAFCEKCGNKIG